MKKKMILITAILGIGFILSLSFFLAFNNEVLKIISISLGVTFYHFFMRLIVGTLVDLVMKNKANYNNKWFSTKRFESKFYNFLHVHKWKKFIPTYSPETFDTTNKSIEEIVGATCQAEVVHEIIMLFSLLPIALIPIFNSPVVFIITSLLSMMIDSIFVILQRYNRPRLIKILKRKLK